MNKQVFLSLTLVALVGFASVMGETGTQNPNANPTPQGTPGQVEQNTGAGKGQEDPKNQQDPKESSSGIRAAYDGATKFCATHCYKISSVVIAGCAFYALYKLCPWFKELVDGTTEAERANSDLKWGATK